MKQRMQHEPTQRGWQKTRQQMSRYGLLLLLLVLALAGCSDRVPDITEYRQTTIDATAGGTVQIEGSAGTATFEFPAGALSKTTKVDHGIFKAAIQNPSGDLTLVGPIYYLGPTCLNDRLTGNVRISLPYVDGSWPGGKLEQNLTIIFYDKVTNMWSPVTSTVQQNINIVTGFYNQVCIFALAVTDDAAVDPFSIDLNALPTTIPQGEISELDWEVRSLTGNKIETVTLFEGRNGDGKVLKVFENIDDELFTGTLNVQPDKATEYTLKATDGTSTQIDRVTVNVLANVDINPANGVDKFRYPIGSVNAPGEFKFTVEGGNLTYVAKTASEYITLLGGTSNKTVQLGETGTVNFTVTCPVEINDTVEIFSPAFGTVGTFQVVCFTPPGVLHIVPDFSEASGVVSATALVQGQDQQIRNINKTLSLSSGAGAKVELPSGNYIISFSDATDGSGRDLNPTAPRQEVFIPPSKTIVVPIRYYIDNGLETPNEP